MGRDRRVERRRHHVVAKALLSGFAEDAKVLCRWRDTRERELSLTNAAVEKDFYSFLGPGGADDAVEVWLSEEVEQPFHSMLEGLRLADAVTDREVDAIAGYVAAGLMRTPAARAQVEQIDEALGGWIALMQIHADGAGDLRGRTQPELDQLAQAASTELRAQQDVQVVKASRLRTMVRKQDELRERLRSYRWCLQDASGADLVLGDVTVIVPQPTADRWHGVLPEGAPAYLPLSPSRALVGYPPGAVLFGQLDPATLGPFVNRLTLAHAFAAVYRHPKSPWPDAPFLVSAPQLPHPRVTFNVTGASGKGLADPQYPTPLRRATRDLLARLTWETQHDHGQADGTHRPGESAEVTNDPDRQDSLDR